MLQSYSAQLQGNQLIWLGSAPEFGPEPLQVLVVLDHGDSTTPQRSSVGALISRARGSLGHKSCCSRPRGSPQMGEISSWGRQDA